MNRTDLRRFAVQLLDDEHGIPAEAWNTLSRELLQADCADINVRVDATNGRFFLPEGHDIQIHDREIRPTDPGYENSEISKLAGD